MSTNTLKKITARAKAIRRAHPKKTWRQAVKSAGAEYRTGKKVGRVKRTRKVKYKRPVVRKSKKRIGTSRGTVGAVKCNTGIGALYDKLGSLHVRRERNTKAGPHKVLTKQINIVRKQIREYKK